MRSNCNEFPRGCNNGIFTVFDRRNKSTKQSIPDGNNGNRIAGEKSSFSSLRPIIFISSGRARAVQASLCEATLLFY